MMCHGVPGIVANTFHFHVFKVTSMIRSTIALITVSVLPVLTLPGNVPAAERPSFIVINIDDKCNTTLCLPPKPVKKRGLEAF